MYLHMSVRINFWSKLNWHRSQNLYWYSKQRQLVRKHIFTLKKNTAPPFHTFTPKKMPVWVSGLGLKPKPVKPRFGGSQTHETRIGGFLKKFIIDIKKFNWFGLGLRSTKSGFHGLGFQTHQIWVSWVWVWVWDPNPRPKPCIFLGVNVCPLHLMSNFTFFSKCENMLNNYKINMTQVQLTQFCRVCSCNYEVRNTNTMKVRFKKLKFFLSIL